MLTHYDLVSANDCPERDPRDWVLEGMPTPGAIGAAAGLGNAGSAVAASPSWVRLDSQQGVRFGERFELRAFTVPMHVRCSTWRLRITSTLDPASANSVQLACLSLYAFPSSPPGSPPGRGPQLDLTAAAMQVRASLSPPDFELLKKLHTQIAEYPGEATFR